MPEIQLPGGQVQIVAGVAPEAGVFIEEWKADNYFKKQMAIGHGLRIGHQLVGFYETTTEAGIVKFVKTCCGEKGGAK